MKLTRPALVLSALAAVLVGSAPVASAAPGDAPSAFVGIDQTIVDGSTYSRTAAVIRNSSPVVRQSWRVVAGPADVGTLVSSAVRVAYTPPRVGTYTIEYRVQTRAGVDVDTVNVSVVARRPAPAYVPKTRCVPFGSGIKCSRP